MSLTNFYAQRNSYRFLKEWTSRQKEVEETLTDVTTTTTSLLIKPHYSTEPLRAGQVRLLSGTSEPLEVLLCKEEGEKWLVVPLSEFSYPATEMEVLFGHLDVKPRVYQLWGWFMYPTLALECKSWVLYSIEKDELKDISRALRFYFGKSRMPKHLLPYIGAKIIFDFDERLVYETRMEERFQEARREGRRILQSEKYLNIVRRSFNRLANVCENREAQIDIPSYAYAAATETEHYTLLCKGGLALDDATELIHRVLFAMPLEECVIRAGTGIPSLIWEWERLSRLSTNAVIFLYNFRQDQILGKCLVKEDAIIYEGKEEPLECDVNLLKDVVLVLENEDVEL